MICRDHSTRPCLVGMATGHVHDQINILDTLRNTTTRVRPDGDIELRVHGGPSMFDDTAKNQTVVFCENCVYGVSGSLAPRRRNLIVSIDANSVF